MRQGTRIRKARTRIAAWLGAMVAALAMTVGYVAPASAVPATSQTVIVAQAAAGDVAAAVKSFRASMTAQLKDYQARYGPRFTEPERTRVSELVTQTDSDLARLAALASATAAWERRGNRARALRAAKAASTGFDAAYARAEAAIAELTPILKPYLNVFEALDAQAALDQRMAGYRSLGGRIKSLNASLR